MKKTFIILLFASSLLNAGAQQLKQKELSDFFSYFIDSILSKDCESKNIFVYKKSENQGFTRCADSSILSSFFSKREVEFIETRYNDTSTYNMSAFIKGGTAGIFEELPKEYFNESSFKERVKSCYCSLSTPVFLRDYNYCIFSYGIAFRKASTAIYKKEFGTWKVLKILCESTMSPETD